MLVHLQSSAAPALGKLSRVDVREVWTNEAVGFTPWLAKEENLQMLGEAIKMQLVLQRSSERLSL